MNASQPRLPAGAPGSRGGQYKKRLHVPAGGFIVLENEDTYTPNDGDIKKISKDLSPGNRNILAANIWQILQQVNPDTPQPVSGIFDESHRASFRKTMTGAGGAAHVARLWLRGETTVEQEELLFAPWTGGDASKLPRRSQNMTPAISTRVQEERIATLLATDEERGNDMWNAALAEATYTYKVSARNKTQN